MNSQERSSFQQKLRPHLENWGNIFLPLRSGIGRSSDYFLDLNLILNNIQYYKDIPQLFKLHPGDYLMEQPLKMVQPRS